VAPNTPVNPRLGGILTVVMLLLAACGATHKTSAHASSSPAGTAGATTAPAATPAAGATLPSSPATQAVGQATATAPTASPARTTAPAPVKTTAPARTTAPAPVKTTAPPATTPPVVTGGLPHFSHVVVILMENEEYGSIIGNPAAPYINSLANQGALATQYYAISHPSLPNYLALSGGSTFGVSSDCNPGPGCQGTGPSIADQLTTAGISWKAYMEGLPACGQAQSDSGEYAVRHDPFMYYPADVAKCGSTIVPATQLSADIAGGQLPQFAWLTPNVCDDMHDTCGGNAIAHGDSYLQGVVPQILGALGPNGALFVTFDEGTSSAGGGQAGAAGGQVTLIAAGPAVKGGAKSSVPHDHYSLLATIEAAWGLPRLGGAASAAPMTELFSGP
jgi:hypothetical protein